MSRSGVSLGVEKAPLSQDTDRASESGRGKETETRWGNLALDYGREVTESPAPGLGLERPLWMVGEGSLLGWLDGRAPTRGLLYLWELRGHKHAEGGVAVGCH